MADSCNCFSKYRLPSLHLQDTLIITDLYKLPVTGFAYGPFTTEDAQASVTFKNLECFGVRPVPSISRDDCDAVTILSERRFQFYMEYVNNKDCYAEIKFPSKVNLKMTVANFMVSI